jgi:SAM-dependent methyltransferase
MRLEEVEVPSGQRGRADSPANAALMRLEQFQINAAEESVHWWFTARRRILNDLIARILPPSPQTTIVDVGCGTGGNAASLSADYTCVGIDPSSEAIQLARRRFPHVRFICGLAPDDLGSVAGRAALFLLTDVLEHVPDDFALFSRLLAAARPGAYLLMTVPADLSLWSLHDESHAHYRRYDQRRLERLWEDLPVTNLLTTYFNARLYPLIKLARMFNKWRGRAAGEAGTDVQVLPRPLNRVLEWVFAGESRVLAELLEGRRSSGFSIGVSLIALLRREAGETVQRRKPARVPLDYYDPATGQRLGGSPSKKAA